MSIHYPLFLILFILVLLAVTSKFFYRLSLKAFMKKITSRHQFTRDDLYLSFDEMVFLTKLYNDNGKMTSFQKEDLVIKVHYFGILFPKVKGVHVFFKQNNEQSLLAYIRVVDFRVPLFDKLENNAMITQKEYLMLSSYTLIHPATLAFMKEEVYHLLQSS
ncbi:hypothetical protein [Alkalihalobacillus sp. LMS39]|uniref:hypothetical protein n=1 Tax=Alkalihalobacillus sp. LMS39 TaxID=2924032 RepID=UPI001FB25B68|nr:hypothetical protein [Alkalihalobacillus sp. LMS39]UOE94015.1 hypothetical protein MM271_23050 [Alkalihalobacillus sp. LMS39]